MDVSGPGPCIDHIHSLHTQLAKWKFSVSDWLIFGLFNTHFKMCWLYTVEW